MIAIKRDGLLTTIETNHLVIIVRAALVSLEYLKEVDDTSKYDTQVKEYQLLLDNLR
jgi:hypothetical protein